MFRFPEPTLWSPKLVGRLAFRTIGGHTAEISGTSGSALFSWALEFGLRELEREASDGVFLTVTTEEDVEFGRDALLLCVEVAAEVFNMLTRERESGLQKNAVFAAGLWL